MTKFSKEFVMNHVEKGDSEKAIELCLDRTKLLMSYEIDVSKDYKTLALLLSQYKQCLNNKIISIIDNNEFQQTVNSITSNFITWMQISDERLWLEQSIKREDEDIPDLSEFVYKPKLLPFFKPKVYRFRAECNHDVQEFLKIAGKNIMEITVTRGSLPDTYVEFTSTMSLEKIRKSMRKVVDGHVMLQTVALKEDYTGERDYDLE